MMKRILLSITFTFALTLFGCGQSMVTSPDVSQASNVNSGSVDETNVDEVRAAIPAGDAAAVTVSDVESGGIVYGEKFPEVLAVEAVSVKDNRWRFNVTLSSSYDTPQRYADAWRVLDEKGEELGIRILGHDHASEQPFTRSATIQLPADTTVVFVEGRDKANGWSGQRFEFKLK